MAASYSYNLLATLDLGILLRLGHRRGICIVDAFIIYGNNNFQLIIDIWLVLDKLLVRPWPDWPDWRLRPLSPAVLSVGLFISAFLYRLLILVELVYY